MSREDRKVDREKDREDIRWFKNHEKRGKIGEHLRNKDILNYIKDIERNCRLEVSSGDEDYAGTKRSSNCSVRFSGARFRSSKRVKSRVTSKRNKSTPSSRRMAKRSSERDTIVTARGYIRSGDSRFRDNPDLVIPEDSKNNLNAPLESILRYSGSLSKPSFYNYREVSSPRFSGWYSRKERRLTWPATTETTSLEIIADHPRNVIGDRRIDTSRITSEKKSGRLRRFKPVHKEPAYWNIYPTVASNSAEKRKNPPRLGEDGRRIAAIPRFNAQSDIQRRLNNFYLERDPAAHPAGSLYRDSSKNERYGGRYISDHRYPVRESTQSVSWCRNSRSNRLTKLRRPETSLRRRALRRQNKVEPPLGASGSITGAGPIDRSYRRESEHKNNMDQRRREASVSGEREPPCCRRPSFLRESGKLRKVAGTREDKLSPSLCCCCEDIEGDVETADCPMHCRRRLENINRRNFRSSEAAALRETSSRLWNDHEETLDFDLPAGERSRRNGTAIYDDSATFDEITGVISDDDRENHVHDYGAQLEDFKSHVSLPDDDWMTYQMHHPSEQIARKDAGSSCELEDNRREAGKTKVRKLLQKRITKSGYSAGQELSFVIRTPRKLTSRDPRRVRYDTTESTCECREAFHDPPAACLAGSCTCIQDNGHILRNENDEDDSSREVSDGEVCCCCCCCCCCCSSSSADKNDLARKLESSYKEVKPDAFHEPSSYPRTYCDGQRRFRHTKKRNQSGTSNEAVRGTSDPTGRRWSTDPAGVRFGRPRHSRDRTNLEKILIYPPRGEAGPPLTLYKGSSNINCQVKGDADSGFRYSVTYVQKFVSPTWMPEAETDAECECSADHG